MTLDVVRTPDSRFEQLPDWDFTPRYLDQLPGYEGLRMAYVDEGPADGPVVLCLHGEPSWGYLYRKLIPAFTAAGCRVVVPDWYGFGRSDKPVDDAVYTWDFHHGSLLGFVDALGLSDLTLVVQDWGGLLGLTLPVSRPGSVSRLLIMNTALNLGVHPGPGFLAWRDYVANTPDLPVDELFARAEPILSPAEAAAYAAPFPDARAKAGVRRFPQLVATEAGDPGVELSREAAGFWSTQWTGDTFMAIGKNDPVLGEPVMQRMAELIQGCPEPLLLDVGHFVPEAGAQIVTAALQAWDG